MLGRTTALPAFKILKPGGTHVLEKSVLQQAIGFDNLCMPVLVCDLRRSPFLGVADLVDDLLDRSHQRGAPTFSQIW